MMMCFDGLDPLYRKPHGSGGTVYSIRLCFSDRILFLLSICVNFWLRQHRVERGHE